MGIALVKKNVQAVLNALGMAVFVIDKNRTVLFANSMGRKLFGKGLTGKSFDAAVSDDNFLFIFDKVLNGQESASADIMLPTTVPTLYRVTVTRFDGDGGNDLFRAAVSLEDISHVRDAQLMRSDFVANVSHELRSPLTAVYGLIETLQGPAKDDPEARQWFLEMMENEAKRMMRLVDDLLSLSKVQAAERQQPEDQLDIVPLLESVVNTLGPVIDTEDKKVTVTSTQLRTHVIGDAEELRQVFQNLIENAVKYSPRGTEVKVYTCAKKTEPGFLCICVSDQGEGIDPADIPRLTERFYRIDKGRSRAKGGTGLGLAIVKHILNRHRAKLKIESEPGKGSTFSVFLPRVGRN